MPIDCPSWSDAGHGVGRCARGLAGGQPSYGVCQLCLAGKPLPTVLSHPKPPVVSDESEARAAARAAICNTCPNNGGLTRYTVACAGCGCAGLSLLNGSCKLGKWDAISGMGQGS